MWPFSDSVTPKRSVKRLLPDLTLQHGLPVPVYTDRHGIFKRHPQQPLTIDEQLRGGPDVARTLAEVAIEAGRPLRLSLLLSPPP